MEINNTIYSFDIFDTCLVRACGDPSMVFSLLAQKLNNNKTFVRDFVKRRTQAEINAALSLKKEAVTISEIYDYFDLQSIGQSKSHMIDLELSVEEDMLRPVYDMLDKINALHIEGHSVVYISDMYLPSAFLKKILEKWGYWKEGDSIFVSGECTAAKHTGNLFRHIARSLDITFKNWRHYGDNPVGDVKVPVRLGIKSHRIKHTYSRYEKQWIKNAAPAFDKEMCEYFAGVSKAIRISNKQDERISLAADVIAPIYIPFVFHVLNHAHQKGITHLYFTARDSYIFYIIAQKLSHLYPEINLFYIYLSRKALCLPSLYDCDTSSYKLFEKGSFCYQTPKSLFNNLIGISISEISAFTETNSDFWTTPLTKDKIPIFYNLLQKPAIKTMISNRSSNARKLLLDYLKQEQLLDNTASAAIVDLGWSGTVSYCLNKILLTEGYHNVFMYYFEVSENRFLYDNNNTYETMTTNRVLGKETLFENYFSKTTQSSTIGYISEGNTIKPLFEEKDNSKFDEICKININTVSQAVDLLLLFPDIKNRIKYSFLNCGMASLKIFARMPFYKEIKVLKNMVTEDWENKDAFIYPLNFVEALQLLCGRFNTKNQRSWKEGSLVAFFPLSGVLLCSIKCLWREKIKILLRKTLVYLSIRRRFTVAFWTVINVFRKF
jgi:predicted HAD superfamily hydrolase